MYGTGSDPLFTKSLLKAGDSILKEILELPVISSLAGSEQLSREKLIEARNNFYLQDYFYLTYGYKLAKTILLDTTSNPIIRKAYAQDTSPMLLEDQNPLLSNTVKIILGQIKKFGLSIAGNRPNEATLEYIIF